MDQQCQHVHIVTDISSGDKICIHCGLIVTEKVLFEKEQPFVYSKTCIETQDVFDMNVMFNEPNYTKCKNKNMKTFKIANAQAMNLSTDENNLSKIYSLLSHCPFTVSSQVTDTVYAILSDIIKTGEFQHIVGPNRRGVIGACIYHACKGKSEQCQRIGLLSYFNIKSSHFNYGRRFLFNWKHKFQPIEWF